MSFNNFHMHTKYCDGANSPKEMADSAFALGCREIGFSDHSWLEFPIDGSPPGSPFPGILQARTLEWVAISFSNVGK